MQPDVAPSGRKPKGTGEPIPTSIGGYRVDGVLGRGGSGIVLRVHDETLDRPLALKLLADDLDDEARARFMVEARAAGRIIHPNVVQVYAVGMYEGRTYITQELVDGYPLSRLLEVRGKLSAVSVIDIGIQAAKGLARAAEVGVVHRDVKPQNLLVTEEGLVKLADFGLAKLLHAPTVLTDTGTTLGTPHYMSPEQGLAQDLDARSDQYSLGATLYHLVTGRAPFDTDNALALLLKHVQEPLVPVTELEPTCPKGLADVIARMLAKKREDRFGSFQEVILALESIDVDDTESVLAEAAADVAKVASADLLPAPEPAPEPIADEAPEASAAGGDRLRDRLSIALAVSVALAVVGVAAFESKPGAVTTGEPSAQLHAMKPDPARLQRTDATDGDPGAFETKSKDKDPKGKDKDKERDKDKDSNKEQKRSRQMPANVIDWLDVLAKDPDRAETAVKALAELRDQRATMPLVKVLETGATPRLRAAAADALGELGDARALEPLEQAAQRSAYKEVRVAAKNAERRLFHVEEEE